MDIQIAQNLAIDLMTEHGLIQLGWKFKLDSARRRFGRCTYRTKTINLSAPLTKINSVEKVQDTILHEIAHALTAGHGHDAVWRAKAQEIGSMGIRCYDSTKVQMPESRYIAVCTTCSHTHKAYRVVRKSQSCGKCDNKYNPIYELSFIHNPNFK